MGFAEPEALVGRDSAGDDDLLVVSGDLGAAYMGLQILEREKTVFEAAPTAQPELEDFAYLLERQLKPEARVDVVREMGDLALKPTSMIDISDGLSSEIMHLARPRASDSRCTKTSCPSTQRCTRRRANSTSTPRCAC